MTSATTPRPRRVRSGGDAGFTLIEVIVALVLVGVVATAALAFFTRGYSASAQVQRSQTATTLANQAMEKVRAISAGATRVTAAGTTTDITGLVLGRQQTPVANQWAASKAPDLVNAWPASDPSATTSSTPAVPLTTPTRVNGQAYTVNTLIGTCYRLRSDTGSATAPAACNRQGSVPPTSNAYVATAQVVVEVLWTPGGSTACPAGTCAYRVTGLVDPNGDLTWNNDPLLVAVADSATVVAGGTVDVDVLANDSGTDGSSTPVIAAPPGTGTASVTGGRIRYVPGTPAGAPVTVTLTYYFTAASGRSSGTATVTITVTRPAVTAVDDAASSVRGAGPVTVDVLGNDTATTTGVSSPVTLLSQPAAGFGTATVSTTGVVTYTPGAQPLTGSGTATFTYRVTDVYGTASNTATVRIALTAPALTAVDDRAAATKGTATTISVLGNDTADVTGVTSPVAIVAGPASGFGTVSVSTSGVVTYTPGAQPSTGSTTATFTYRITDRYGSRSNTATVTVTVTARPVAVDDTARITRPASGTTSGSISVLANDTTTGSSTVTVLTQPANGLGTATATSGGTVTFTTGTAPATGSAAATFTYRITDGSGTTSNTATVTVTVYASPAPVSFTTTINAQRTASAENIPFAANDGTTDPDAFIRILTLPSSGTLRAGGAVAGAGSTGTAFTYTPEARTIGTYTVSYAVVSGGLQSASATATIRVVPVAADYARSARSFEGTQSVTLGGDDTPPNWRGLQLSGYTPSASCNTLLASGGIDTSTRVLTWDPSGRGIGTCTITYTLSGSTSDTSSLSGTGTITLRVDP